MLEDQLLVMYGDYEIPSASYKVVMEENGIVMPSRRFYVYDRGGAMETLGQCDNAVMWITSLHPDTLRKEGIVLRRCEDVNVRDMGYSIYPSEEGISPAARELYEKMQQVDWMMTDREDYFASQRPEAPQGSTSPAGGDGQANLLRIDMFRRTSLVHSGEHVRQHGRCQSRGIGVHEEKQRIIGESSLAHSWISG